MIEREKLYSEQVRDGFMVFFWKIRMIFSCEILYFNVIIGYIQRQFFLDICGGIFVDMMGLGKILSVLFFVLGSFEDVQVWVVIEFKQLVVVEFKLVKQGIYVLF